VLRRPLPKVKTDTWRRDKEVILSTMKAVASYVSQIIPTFAFASPSNFPDGSGYPLPFEI
jgi:hypothetical protein